MGKEAIWPNANQKPLNRWSSKFVLLTRSVISTSVQKFIQIGLGVSVLRMHDFTPLGTKWLGFFFGGWEVLEKGYRRDACTDCDAKYDKRRGSTQGSAVWGVAKPISKVLAPIFLTNRHFWAKFRWDNIFSPENVNSGRLESKRPLVVVGAQWKLYSE